MIHGIENIRPLDHFQVRSPPWHIFGGIIRAVLGSRSKNRKCFTNHDAPVWADRFGVLWVTEIRWPRNKTYQLNEWIQMKLAEGNTLVVVRPHAVCLAEHYMGEAVVKEWGEKAAAYWCSLDGQKYPLRDLYIIWRNWATWLLKKLSLVKPDFAHVYCTEGTLEGYKKAGISIESLQNVFLVTPWHFEEADRRGDFCYVAGDKALWHKIIDSDEMSTPKEAVCYAG